MTRDLIPDWAPLHGRGYSHLRGYQPWNAGDGVYGEKKEGCHKVSTGWQTYLQLQVEEMDNLDLMSLYYSISGRKDTGKRHPYPQKPRGKKPLEVSGFVLYLSYEVPGQGLCFDLSDYWFTPQMGLRVLKASEFTRVIQVSPPASSEQGTCFKNLQ